MEELHATPEELQRFFNELPADKMVEFAGASLRLHDIMDDTTAVEEAMGGGAIVHLPPEYRYQFLYVGELGNISNAPHDVTQFEETPQEPREPWPFELMAQDVDYLDQQRIEQTERIAAELQTYATQYVAARGELDVNERAACESCKGSGLNTSSEDGQCWDCNSRGYNLLHPVISLSNNVTGDAISLPLDIIKWIADGDVPVRWANEEELGYGPSGGRAVVDIKAFFKKEFSKLGIDVDDAIEPLGRSLASVTFATLEFLNIHFDEWTFVPDLVEQLESRATRYLHFDTSGDFALSLRPKRSVDELLRELMTEALKFGCTVGYHHYYSRETSWDICHNFILLNDGSTKIANLVPDDLLVEVDLEDPKNLALALEGALEGMRLLGEMTQNNSES